MSCPNFFTRNAQFFPSHPPKPLDLLAFFSTFCTSADNLLSTTSSSIIPLLDGINRILLPSTVQLGNTKNLRLLTPKTPNFSPPFHRNPLSFFAFSPPSAHLLTICFLPLKAQLFFYWVAPTTLLCYLPFNQETQKTDNIFT